MFDEASFLRMSIAATAVVAAFGIVFGLLSGSFSIAFDGVYSFADAGMTVMAIWASSLIARSAKGDTLPGRMRDRFTMRFWHLEPIVLLLNGTLLIVVAIYALINAVISVLRGDHELQFGFAIVYAAFTVVACTIMAVTGARVNRKLQSDFIALDVKAWIMSGGIAFALLLAFLLRYGVRGTPLGWISAYVDPAVLALVCIVIIPLPIGIVRQALSERRVAHAVLRLSRQAGKQEKGGVRIDFPISRRDIAEMTGTTLHTVSRILSAWEQDWSRAVVRSSSSATCRAWRPSRKAGATRRISDGYLTSIKEQVLYLFYLLVARTERGSETKENFKCA